MMSFGAMITILVTWWMQSQGISFGVLPTALLALPFGIIATIFLVLTADRVVFKYYRSIKSPPVTLLIVSMGLMFFLGGLIRFIIGPNDQRFFDGERFIFKGAKF